MDDVVADEVGAEVGAPVGVAEDRLGALVDRSGPVEQPPRAASSTVRTTTAFRMDPIVGHVAAPRARHARVGPTVKIAASSLVAAVRPFRDDADGEIGAAGATGQGPWSYPLGRGRAGGAGSGAGRRRPLSASALTATMTLEPDIDRAAISGRSTSPNDGSNTPAAIGSAIAL